MCTRSGSTGLGERETCPEPADKRSRSTVIMPSYREVVDRKSTRLNSSHSQISYAVFCLKKNTLVAKDSDEIRQGVIIQMACQYYEATVHFSLLSYVPVMPFRI